MEQNDIELVGRDYDPQDPVALADDDEVFPDDQPYPLPELPLSHALAVIEEVTARQVATVRDERSELIANLGLDALPHFLLNRDGGEFCGSDGQPWPCTAFQTEIDPAAVVASSDVAPEAPFTAGEVAAAEALGITAAEVRERMSTR